MSQTLEPGRRCFHAQETAHLMRLDGLPLAVFGHGALGYAIDLLLVFAVSAPLEDAWRRHFLHEEHIDMKFDFHEPGNIVVLLLYLGLSNY